MRLSVFAFMLAAALVAFALEAYGATVEVGAGGASPVACGGPGGEAARRTR
jgi:hypothetical protein